MRHLNLELETLEQRIAPGGCGYGNGSGSKSSGSKSSGSSKSHSKSSKSSKSHSSKSSGSKSSGSKWTQCNHRDSADLWTPCEMHKNVEGYACLVRTALPTSIKVMYKDKKSIWSCCKFKKNFLWIFLCQSFGLMLSYKSKRLRVALHMLWRIRFLKNFSVWKR